MQGRAVGDALAQGFQPGLFRFTNLVLDKIERRLAVIALDREYLLEHHLQADALPPRGGHGGLEKILVGLDLGLDQVRWFNQVSESSEIFALRHNLVVPSWGSRAR